MEIKRLSDTLGGAGKFILYGPSGSGKTYSLRTLPEDETVIISTERGLRSLRKAVPDMAVLEVSSMDEMREAFVLALDFQYIVLDSLSKLAAICLNEEKQKTAHGQKAYGAMEEQITKVIDAFILTDKTCIIIAQEERVNQEMAGVLDYTYGPSVPGKKYQSKIAYFFDFVFCMRAGQKGEEGNIEFRFQTGPNGDYLAKTRDPGLDTFELPDWNLIIQKLED
jgi:hypothetical protein